MNLYELTQEHARVEELILANMDEETGEIIASDELEKQSARIALTIESKLGGIARIVRNCGTEADDIKAEEKRLADRRKILENKVKRLKEWAKLCLEAAGMQKFRDSLFTVSIQANGGNLPLLFDDWKIDPKDLPARFQKITIEADKSAIRSAVEAGEELPYARIGERGTSVRIR